MSKHILICTYHKIQQNKQINKILTQNIMGEFQITMLSKKCQNKV